MVAAPANLARKTKQELLDYINVVQSNLDDLREVTKREHRRLSTEILALRKDKKLLEDSNRGLASRLYKISEEKRGGLQQMLKRLFKK